MIHPRAISHEALIPYLAKISDLYPLAILKVDKLKKTARWLDALWSINAFCYPASVAGCLGYFMGLR